MLLRIFIVHGVIANLLISTSMLAAEPISVPAVQLDLRFQLIGKLHQPLGKLLNVEGFIVHGAMKGYESSTQLRVTRINDQATQEDIQISLANETFVIRGDEKPDAEIGKHYRFSGYETGGYVGHPDLWKGGPTFIGTTRHYFRLMFRYSEITEISQKPFVPSDFAGRRALFQGVAADSNGQAVMEGKGWTIVVNEKSPWPKGTIGKQVETLGMHSRQKGDDSGQSSVDRVV